MIYVLHGEDTGASYARLSQLLEISPGVRIRIGDKSPKEEILLTILAQDLFSEKRIIICENCLRSKKVDLNLLKKVPEDNVIILWEAGQIDVALLSKIANLAKVEIFKPPPALFWFLDAISPNKKQVLKSLADLEDRDQENLLWNISNRLLLLILAKLAVEPEMAGKVVGRPILDWQWSKILAQAKNFDFNLLYNLYSAALKIDVMRKKGLTDLNEKTLIEFLFLKYLKD